MAFASLADGQIRQKQSNRRIDLRLLKYQKGIRINYQVENSTDCQNERNRPTQECDFIEVVFHRSEHMSDPILEFELKIGNRWVIINIRDINLENRCECTS